MKLRFAAAFVLPILLAACSFDMEPIDPPSLQLQPMEPRTPSSLPRGDYVLTNGQGEVLMEAKAVAPEQNHEARFDTEKLDGTINVTVTRDGQTIYTQKLEHTPEVPVRLTWDNDVDRFVLAEEPAGAPGAKTERDGGGGGHD